MQETIDTITAAKISLTEKIGWAFLPILVAIFSIIFLYYYLCKRSSGKHLKKKYINRMLLFFRTVWLENPIEITVGLAGQYLLIIFLGNPEYLRIYSLVFLTVWATPVIKGLLSNLEGTYEKAFREKLARLIQRINDHYIVIDYKGLGRFAVKDLFENYVYNEEEIKSVYSEGIINKFFNKLKRLFSMNANKKPISSLQMSTLKDLYKKNRILKLEEINKIGKPILLLERMINEKCEDVLFCSNLIVIDQEEKVLNNVFSHPHFEKIGLVILDRLHCLSNDKENQCKKIYIPAIVGDIKNNATLALARIDKSKMVLSLMSEGDATLHLFNIIQKKQQEKKGIIAGTTTAQERLLVPQSYGTNISFLHVYRIRGWALGNIVAANLFGKIESQAINNTRILILGSGKQIHFMLEKIWFEILWKKKAVNNSFLKNNCLIIGDDPYINNSTITESGHTYWHHELAYVTNRIVYKRNDYVMDIPFLKGIPHEPTLLGPIISGEVYKDNCWEKEPFNTILSAYYKKRPNIVIVSSDSHNEIVKIFNELNSILRKYNLKPKPIIISESNANVDKVITELNPARIATNDYSTKYPIPFLNKPYPIEFSENIVNAFHDGNKMVRGYMEAMTSQEQDGVILRACVEDKPGTFAKLCFLLANLKLESNTKSKNNTEIPSFHNTQVFMQRNNYFCFFSDSDIISPASDKDSANIENNANHIREVFISSNNQENKKWLINSNNSLIPKNLNEKPLNGPCMGLTFCPVCSFRHSIETEPDSLIKADKENALWSNKKECNSNIIQSNNRYKKYARVFACGNGGNSAGSLAMLLYKFKLGDQKITNYVINRDQKVLNIKYVMNVECYNPGFELLKMYGKLEPYESNINCDALYSDCLRGVVISPISAADDWLDYSKKLIKKMNQALFYYDGDDENLPNNILIITNEYKDILLKEYVQLQIQKIIDKLSIESEIDEPAVDELKFEFYEILKRKKLNDNAKTNINKFTTDTLNTEITKYIKERKKKDKSEKWINPKDQSFGDFIANNFIELGATEQQEILQSCICPITECSFKRKAIYLLIEGKISPLS